MRLQVACVDKAQVQMKTKLILSGALFSLVSLQAEAAQLLKQVKVVARGNGVLYLLLDGKPTNVGSIVETKTKYEYNLFPFYHGKEIGKDFESIKVTHTGDVEILSVEQIIEEKK